MSVFLEWCRRLFFHFHFIKVSISISMCRSPKANFDNERIERKAKEKQTIRSSYK